MNFKSACIHSTVLLQAYALTCATCVVRLLAFSQCCCANKQHYRICKQGPAWTASWRQSQGRRAAARAWSSLGSIRDTAAVRTGNFLLRQLFLGGGLGVGQEQRLISVLPLTKLLVPNPPDLDLHMAGSILTLIPDELKLRRPASLRIYSEQK